MALLDNATNLLGPIEPEYRARIVKYLSAPTEEGWDEIHGIVIDGHRTLWQAVHAVDPLFPMVGPVSTTRNGKSVKLEGWKRIPDALLLARAIKAALT